jgi:hypothetical protein
MDHEDLITDLSRIESALDQRIPIYRIIHDEAGNVIQRIFMSSFSKVLLPLATRERLEAEGTIDITFKLTPLPRMLTHQEKPENENP